MKLYNSDSYLREKETLVSGSSVFEGETELTVEELLFHPSGGGQPDDQGKIVFGENTFLVKGLRKHKGEVRILLQDGGSLAPNLGFGDSVLCQLDWDRRYRLMRLHSAAHVLMACARKSVVSYVPSGMQIAPDLLTSAIRFKHAEALSSDTIQSIGAAAKEAVSSRLGISSREFPNLEAARETGKALFRMDPSVQLKGTVRVVEIENLDFNPCGGTHVRNTEEIGQITIKEWKPISSDATEIQYALEH